MKANLNKPQLFLSLGIVLLTAVSAFCAGVPGDDQPSPSMVWSRGNTVLVFASFPACEDESATPHRTMQTLISKDGGKTWNWRGPRMPWSMLEYILVSGDEIWLAGENYNPEGPASEPFLLPVDGDSMEWPQLEIYDRYTELTAVARDDHDGNRFLAWVNHLMLPADDPDLPEDGSDPMFLHESLDRGRKWHVIKKEKDVPKSPPGLRFFEPISEQSGTWRISKTSQSSASELEHKKRDGKWHPAGRLPSPIQNCVVREENVEGQSIGSLPFLRNYKTKASFGDRMEHPASLLPSPHSERNLQ